MATGHFGIHRFGTVRGLLRRAGYKLDINQIPPVDAIHYLHIGKSAGTRIMGVIDALNAQAGRIVMLRRTHQTALRDLPRCARYFFSIRDPVSRFVSGFYSRLNENRPSLHSPWTFGEDLVFGYYDHAAQLADDLFEPGAVGRRAVEAMCSLGHAPAQISWFNEAGCFLSHRPPIWIIRQEHFDSDLDEFLRRGGFDYAHPKGERSNAASGESRPALSEKGRSNLERWYAADLAFYSACEEWILTHPSR